MNPILPDIFQGAAADIEKYGWCQESDSDEALHLCMRGAIKTQLSWHDFEAAMQLSEEAYAVVAPLLDVASRYSPEDKVTYWNDMEGRTVDEVIAKLREAADAAEAVL